MDRLKRGLLGSAAIILAGAVVLLAGAPTGRADDRGEYRYRYDDGNCRYEYREKKGKVRERVRCDDDDDHRRKDDHHRRTVRGPDFFQVPGLPWRPVVVRERDVYRAPPDLRVGRCNSALSGAILGGAAGGVLGAQFGKGDGQLAATAAGVLIGALLGSDIGRSLDRTDQACFGRALEYGPDGRAFGWSQPDGRVVEVVPRQTYRSGGTFCRDYTMRGSFDGRAQRITGTACREGDGRWRIVS